tara:strand:- start:2898 stop:3767 length:870 start_codon:yes stop_codon:yes gene_type:complete
VKFEGGNIFSIDFMNQTKLLELVDRLLESDELEIKLFSRLPPRRLLEHIDISRIELYWITERTANNSVAPNLDKLMKIISLPADSNEIIIMDGFEWLIELHGNDKILNFLNDLSDNLQGTSKRLVIPLDVLNFEKTWLSRFKKVIKHVNLDFNTDDVEVFEEKPAIINVEDSEQNRIEFDLGVDGMPRLSMLSRLPKIGFTNSLLVKRILQWRRMGLDVSEVEPALNYDSEDAYALYSVIEEKVRRVVELENYLYHHKDKIDVKEFTTSLFRIKQLTGIDELEKKYYSN